MAAKKKFLSDRNISIVLLLLIVLVATVFFARLYQLGGPSWDLIVHYLNGKSVTNPILYSNQSRILKDVTWEGPNVYYEAYRAPVSVFIFAILDLFASKPLFTYCLLLYLAFLVAIYFFSKWMEMDWLVTYAALVSPYVLLITFFLSSEEIVSLIFLLVSIPLIIKKKPIAGVTLALASLGKYTALAFLPTILLLREPKKIMEGLLLEFAVILPWLVFNFFLSGRPFTSYIQSYATVLGSAPITIIFPSALFVLLSYPFLLLVAYLAIRSIKRGWKNPFGGISLRKMSPELLVITIFVIIGIAQFLFVAPHHDPIAQERYGYSMVLVLSVFFGYLIGIEGKGDRNVKFVLAGICIFALLASLLVLSGPSGIGLTYYNPNSNASVFHSVALKLDALGYGNCRIISNSWVYMRYIGFDAYLPIYENASQAEYPIVMLTKVGPNLSGSGWLQNDQTVYSDSNFSVLLPPNYTCYTT
jgi:hypothetical protein